MTDLDLLHREYQEALKTKDRLYAEFCAVQLQLARIKQQIAACQGGTETKIFQNGKRELE